MSEYENDEFEHEQQDSQHLIRLIVELKSIKDLPKPCNVQL